MTQTELIFAWRGLRVPYYITLLNTRKRNQVLFAASDVSDAVLSTVLDVRFG